LYAGLGGHFAGAVVDEVAARPPEVVMRRSGQCFPFGHDGAGHSSEIFYRSEASCGAKLFYDTLSLDRKEIF